MEWSFILSGVKDILIVIAGVVIFLGITFGGGTLLILLALTGLRNGYIRRLGKNRGGSFFQQAVDSVDHVEGYYRKYAPFQFWSHVLGSMILGGLLVLAGIAGIITGLVLLAQ